MSGLQEIAAIVGIAELSIRSISSLYEFVSSLKHVPKELRRLQSEISTLVQSFSALDYLDSADSETKAIVQRVGLPAAIASCGGACQALQQDLLKWTKAGQQSLTSRIQVRLHKKAIESLLAHIDFAKQTTILCVVITQL